MLIIKQTQPMTGGRIVVAVDGSPYSFGGLMTGLALGAAIRRCPWGMCSRSARMPTIPTFAWVLEGWA